MAKLPAIAGSATAVGRASAETAAAAPTSAAEFLGQLVEALQPPAPSGIAMPGAATPVQASSNASSTVNAPADASASQAGCAQPAATLGASVQLTKLQGMPPATILLAASQPRASTDPKRADTAHKTNDKLNDQPKSGTSVPVAVVPVALPVAAPPPPAHSPAMAGPSRPDSSFILTARITPPDPSVAAIPSALTVPAQPTNDSSAQAQPPRKASDAQPDTAHRLGSGPAPTVLAVPGLQTRSTSEQTLPMSLPPSASVASSPATPGAQLGAALHTLATAPDGTQQISLQLHPAELGHVAVQIVQPKDGPVTVQISVERPETMQLLMHDQPQLQQMLNQAGIPAAGRVVSYNLAPPVGQPVGTGVADPGMNGRQREGGSRRRRAGHMGGFALTAITPGAAWRRAGIDITA